MIHFQLLVSLFLVIVPIIFGSPTLFIHNNGPAVLDGSITFYSDLQNFKPSSSLFYIFDDIVRKQNFTFSNTSLSTVLEFPSSVYKEGCYFMTISVYERRRGKKLIAVNRTNFELSDSLVGEIVVFRSDGNIDVDEVAVGDNFTVAVHLHDPNNFLEKADINYMWSIDYDQQSFMQRNFSYMYSELQTSLIVANVVADFQQNNWKSGIFKKTIKAKDPVKNVNISGNPFIHHGEMLLLNVSCNGSLPFSYCAKPLQANESADNFTCQHMVSTTCSFSIQRYFRNYGSYHYGIYISNDVKTVKKVVEVVVYNVSKQPQLSTVIIPIACTLLTLFIIIGGVAYCIQQRSHIAIEVANFDFQEEESEPNISRTFFERLFDSVRCGCSKNRFDDLYNEDEEPLYYEEEEPLINQHRPRRIS